MRTPNIFEYATSELSQDAMFAWLLSWADDKYLMEDPELCQLGKKFVSLLTEIPIEDIHDVEAGRQWEHIDVWAEINDDTFLLIEDKTGTSIHDGQLQRYRKIAEDYYRDTRPNICCTYVKTHNESRYVLDYIRSERYNTFCREDILSVLNAYKGNHRLVIDYRSRLIDMSAWTNNYKTMSVGDWKWYEWQGFYMDLESRLDTGKWHYVANPSGGFQCFWWHEIKIEDVYIKLQFEEAKLCFKVYYDGTEDNSAIRWKYYNRLMGLTKTRYPEIQKPDRFGNGANMTIGYVNQDNLFGTGVVDVDAVVSKLHQYEKLVDEMAS